MTSTPPLPFLKLKARSIVLQGVLLSLSLGFALSIVANLTGLNAADAAVTPILYILILGLLCGWILRRFKQLHGHPIYVVGRLPDNQKWLPLAGLVLALLVFSLSAFQVSFSLLSIAAPTFVEAVLKSIRAQAEPQTAIPWLYSVLNPIALVIVAPITEEFLFRGVLLQRWATKWNVQAGLLVSSLLFGLLHANVVGLSMFGLVMGVLYLKSRTLWVPIACHALNNLAAFSMGLISESSTPTEAVNDLEQLRSSWWVGLLLMAISAPWLIRFIYKNFPRKDAPIPYLVNASHKPQSRG